MLVHCQMPTARARLEPELHVVSHMVGRDLVLEPSSAVSQGVHQQDDGQEDGVARTRTGPLLRISSGGG